MGKNKRRPELEPPTKRVTKGTPSIVITQNKTPERASTVDGEDDNFFYFEFQVPIILEVDIAEGRIRCGQYAETFGLPGELPITPMQCMQNYERFRALIDLYVKSHGYTVNWNNHTHRYRVYQDHIESAPILHNHHH